MELGQSYHIYNHTNGSENLFREEDNYRFFLRKYTKHVGDVVDTYAYCLMPNHFHFLVGVKSEEVLTKTFPKIIPEASGMEKLISKRFSNFFSSYTQSFNKVYYRKGSLFIKNFKRRSIDSQLQWQETFLYLHLNPIKHGFVDKVDDWKWSSWEAYIHQERPSMLDRSYYKNFFDGMEHVETIMAMKKEMILNKKLE